VLIVGLAGHHFVVAPQSQQVASIQKQIDDTQNQIYKRQAELKAGSHPPVIDTADVFKLARAMPDTEDMPGIILTLSHVAQQAGISFDLIEPSLGTAPVATGSFQVERIHLLFNGDFYGLSDFLYRLRNLVVVRNGNLDASGRLFNVDTLTFSEPSPDAFPHIQAELYVDAYIYASGSSSSSTSTTAPAATTTTTTTTSTDSTTTTPAPTSSDASATGVTG
jgi:hypothetical protein